MANNFRVDGFVTGLAIKSPVHTVLTANIPVLTGVGQNINGWIVGAFDRVLVTAQTNPIDNGIYSARTSAWIRDGDADGNRDFVGGTIVPVWNPGLADIVLWNLSGDPDAKTVGVDPLLFTLYYDPSSSVEIDTLQSVTDRGATTDVPITLNPPGPATTMLALDTGGLLSLANSLDTGGITMGHSASTTMRLSATGLVTGFQFEGLTEYLRLLGNGGATGPALVFEERPAATASIPGFAQIWVLSTSAPNELIFTNDDDQDINLTAELWDNGTRQVLSNPLGAAVRTILFIGDDDNGFGLGAGSLYIADRATPAADFTGQGQFWVRSTDDAPMYTSQAGVDSVLNSVVSGVSGAKAYHNANQVIGGAGADVVLAFNQEAYDTATIHDTVTNNSRLTVPAGVTRIKLRGNIRWQASSSSYRSITMRKNGAGGTIDDAMIWQPRAEMTANVGPNSWDQQIDTGVITVAATDYFELLVRQGSGGNLNAESSETWFEMEIIE